MNNQVLQLKVKQRLNKLASSDFDNIECWQIVEAFNKGMSGWCRRNLHGENIVKEGDEQSTSRIDDLQILLTVTPTLTLVNRQEFYEADKPLDYLRFKRISAKAMQECCPDPRKLVIYLGEDGNTDLLVRDKNKKPSFEWAETFGAFVGNKLRIYTNDEFQVQDAVLIYYRQPKKIQITNCKDPYTGIIPAIDVICEFNDDLTEVLIDEAAKILSGDIESIVQIQRNKENVETNN